MVKVKSLERISKNFEASIGEASRRYREGVAAQREGFRPYADALSGVDLGPKGLDPVANVDRVRKIVEVMVAKKKEIG